MGAITDIPDMGAWQFTVPDGLRTGKFSSSPTISGATESDPALTGKLGDEIVVDGEFGANQK